MLTKQPDIGQNIRALQDGYWDEDWGDQYQTTGKTYKLVGISEISGNPYFIDDTEQEIYVDRDSWFMYELVD